MMTFVESTAVENRHMQEQLHMLLSPRKRKSETVKPTPSKQTASALKAEMEHIQQMKRVLIEGIMGGDFLIAKEFRRLVPPPAAEPELPRTSKRTFAHNIELSLGCWLPFSEAHGMML